jgi:hypothetical protein
MLGRGAADVAAAVAKSKATQSFQGRFVPLSEPASRRRFALAPTQHFSAETPPGDIRNFPERLSPDRIRTDAKHYQILRNSGAPST